VSRFQFVADHQDAFEVKQLCTAVQIARSSFYAWQQAAAGRAQRAAADALLAEQIRAVHHQDKAYGAPRVTAELNDGAPPQDRVNHKRIARVMRQHRIAGVRLRRRVRTTIPQASDQKVPDLLKRDFTAAAPHCMYVRGHHLPAARVRQEPLPCDRHRLLPPAHGRVGPGDHMRTDLITTALTDALATRGSLAGVVFHADHGAWSIHLEGIRGALQPAPGPPVHGRGREQRRQRPRGGLQRHPQARAPARRSDLFRRAHLPPGGLPLGHPLQHPAPPLLVQLAVPEHLRRPERGCSREPPN